MKFTMMLLLSLVLGKGCESQQKQDIEGAVLEYTANTRGFYERITISNHEVSVSADRNNEAVPKTEKLSDAEWNALVAAFQKIDLEAIPTLKAPTEKRFYDGAAIAKLKVTFQGKTYESTEFDHGTPPAAIASLVNQINQYSNRK